MIKKLKHSLLIISILGINLLIACASATPLPTLTVTTDSEFALAPNQTATLTDTDLTIRLIGITNDERCPSEIECAISGPVSLNIAVQRSDMSVEFDLQTFTSNDGRAPDGAFEGIEDRIEYQGYLIQVKSVLPYPAKAFDEIKASEYRVIFIVSTAE